MKIVSSLVVALVSIFYVGCASTSQQRIPNQVSTDFGKSGYKKIVVKMNRDDVLREDVLYKYADESVEWDEDGYWTATPTPNKQKALNGTVGIFYTNLSINEDGYRTLDQLSINANQTKCTVPADKSLRIFCKLINADDDLDAIRKLGISSFEYSTDGLNLYLNFSNGKPQKKLVLIKMEPR